MEQRQGPFPSPAFLKQLGANDPSPMMAVFSGELTANVTNAPLGACNVAGKLSDAWLSVEAGGKDDSNTLSLTADVKINGTTCLTTQPVISHVSGESGTNKTTKEAGDTGVTLSVIDADANAVSPGDVITYDMVITRTASPTTEMRNFVVVVEFEPA